ncbi:TIGR02221 family CRISPR-associated protein [Aerosakkonema sp. BLCC-F183]|uniref:TIGR02221 family CRISPR-associated protein n=1 Tax=Aerosakkonema sp. BLCC-F183 TaxID=3342834 RepID=UPI0035B8E8F1
MQLLTFLGVFNLETTQFTWQEKPLLENPSPYVVEALLKFNEIQKISVFLTPEAEQHKNWKGLQECISKHKKISIEPVPISSKQTEEELWNLFVKVVDAVPPNSEIIFDITHAFRSIPFLAFLVTAFLQKARSVTVKSVYYGAFDRNQPETPIIDLTPAIKLLDWLTATEQFITTGSSINLGNLLSKIQQDFSSQDRQKITPPRLLEKLGTSIQDISRSLELIRSMGVLKETAKLQKIPAQELAKEVGYFAKPFELLSEQIQQSYGQFALSDPEKLENSQSSLQKQFLLLRWYVKKEQGTQAILLAREWLVSARCVAKGMDYLNKGNREQVEDELNQMKGSKPHLTLATARTKDDKITLTWSNLIKYRNDIAHAEMRRNSAEATQLQQYVKNKLIQEIETVFSEFTV